MSTPVIAIDGPSASGKGTLARAVAQRLGFHYLESGALYRLVALAARHQSVALDDAAALASLAAALALRFHEDKIFMNQEDVTESLREEAIGNAASKLAALPPVRTALLARQRAFCAPPGLVADGRDMGSVVFPGAGLKIYLTASAEERARRRYKQLIDKGLDANMAALLQDIQERDRRDSTRAAAPLQKSRDASVLDTTTMSISDAVDEIMARYAATQGRG